MDGLIASGNGEVQREHFRFVWHDQGDTFTCDRRHATGTHGPYTIRCHEGSKSSLLGCLKGELEVLCPRVSYHSCHPRASGLARKGDHVEPRSLRCQNDSRLPRGFFNLDHNSLGGSGCIYDTEAHGCRWIQRAIVISLQSVH